MEFTSQASDTEGLPELVRNPLRDEILAIQQLFGYSDNASQTLAHEVCNFGATLSDSSMRDVLLLHIGISILDTRILHRMMHVEPTDEIHALESYQFVVGDSRYCKTTSKRFLFGESQFMPLDEVKAQVESPVCRRGRDNILVFHGDHSDRKALSNLNIERQPLYVIDNVEAAQSPLNLTYRLGLDALLDTFGIPYANLHAVGNDAHYALRSLLMIAVTDGLNLQAEPTNEVLFSTFSAIARRARPTTAG
ncbi:hypothetical protein F5Y18DRAFT_430807 [Xylariaceae sp. FL1019]|nr:hypothetical protein F5Y18DRAFT_430807 [Xylariaceae sp. FL1019]